MTFTRCQGQREATWLKEVERAERSPGLGVRSWGWHVGVGVEGREVHVLNQLQMLGQSLHLTGLCFLQN